MPQKEQTDIWVEGIEPAPKPKRKAPAPPKLTGRQKMERFRMPPIQNFLKANRRLTKA